MLKPSGCAAALLIALTTFLNFFAGVEPAGAQALQVVQACGTPNAPLVAGSANGPITVDINGTLCIGAPTPAGTASPLLLGVQGGGVGSLPISQPDAGNITNGNGSGTCAATCNGTALFGPLDTSGFATVDMYFTSAGTSNTVTMQESEDNSTWVTHTGCFNGNNAIATTETNASAGPNLSLTCPVHKRYFRAQFTAYASGTITAFWVMRHQWYLPNTNLPYGATQVVGVGTGTTGAVTATLTGAANVKTCITSFDVSAEGTTTISPITVTNLGGQTFTYRNATAGAVNIPFIRVFNPAICTSAVNTSIVVSTTADASATAVAVNATGYTQ